MSARRVSNEIRQIQQDLDGITESTGGYVQVFPSADVPNKFRCVMHAPNGSPYDGGVFFISISLPENYPISPPKMHFETPIWHPLVTWSSGAILLDFLSDNWSTVWTLQAMLLVVWSTLKDPARVYGLANPEAAKDCHENSQEFVNKAQHYTRLHAGAEKVLETQTRIIDRLTQMGFEPSLARSVLERTSWNEDAAVTELLALLGGDDPSAAFSDSSYSFVHEFSQLQVQDVVTAATTAGSNSAVATRPNGMGEWVNIG